MKSYVSFFALIASLSVISFDSDASSRIDTFDRNSLNTIDFVRPTFGQESRNPRPAFRTIDGAATKGPIANANISVYEIDDTGMPVGSAVATSTTNSSGEFSVSLPASASGMLMVKTSGGSFIDESDTRPLDQRRRISLGSGEGFMSIILNSQSSVAVTPYTDAMVERALASSSLGGFKDKMQEIMTASTNGFGFSIFETMPADPAAPASGADSAQMQYALLLGASANVANVAALKMGMAAPTFEVLKAMIYDFMDGDSDGLQFGEHILVNGKMFPEIDFDQQLERFRNNNFASYRTTTLPEWDSAEEDLGGIFGPGEFFSYFVEPIPRRWGLSLFGIARTERRADGTGTHYNGVGGGDYIWGEVDGELILDFTPFGGKNNGSSVSFASNGQGGQDEIQNTTYLERLVFSFGPDGLQVTPESRFESVNITTGELQFSSSFVDDPFPIFLANKKDSLEIDEDPPEFESNPALPQLIDGEPPFSPVPIYVNVDGMTFNADGTGVTTFEQDTFTWQMAEDRKSIKVDFDNGESAVYYLIFGDDPEFGDFVGADYIDSNGKRFFISSIVFSDVEEIVFTTDNVNRQFSSAQSTEIRDGVKSPFTRRLNLYSNGTGVQEYLGFFDFENGDHIMARGGFCWSINENGRLKMRFAEFDFDRGFVPTPEDCDALQISDQFFDWDVDLYDEFNGEFDVVLAESPFFGGTELELTGVIPMSWEGDTVFSANPPIPVDDVHSTSPDEPITIDPFANDIVVDQAIDPTTVEITGGPLNLSTFGPAAGTVSVDPSSGAITYTPDASDSGFREIEMNYRYRDVAGNITSQGRVFIIVEFVQTEPPLSSLSGVYSGTYSWNCGPSSSQQGSTSMTLDISNNEGSSDVFGTVSLLGASTSVNGSRLDLPTMGLFGFEGGTLDPNGMYVHLFYGEVDNAFVQNELSLEITETGLVGIARNGDSGVGGCALSTGAAGTVELTKQSSPSPRLRSSYAGSIFNNTGAER